MDLIYFVACMAFVLFGMIFARELGARLRLRSARKLEQNLESEMGYLLSGVLGLLALLTAFTFSLALDRYETRRDLVVSEANALGTAFLRADLLPNDVQLKQMIAEYTLARISAADRDSRNAAGAERKASQLQQQIWTAAIGGLGDRRATALAGTVLTPLNEAFDTAAARRAERAAKLPATVLVTLLLYAITTAAVIGFTIPARELRGMSITVFALLSLSFGLIIDLDQPRLGAIKVPQAPMEEVYAAMNAS